MTHHLAAAVDRTGAKTEGQREVGTPLAPRDWTQIAILPVGFNDVLRATVEYITLLFSQIFGFFTAAAN